MFRVDDEMALRYHVYSDRVRYRDGAWFADGGWYRELAPDRSDEFHRITSPLELPIEEEPGFFGQEYRRPSEMSFGELIGYIRELRASGYEADSLVVRLHQKLSNPLAAFVMVFLALPFGLNRGGHRVTTMQGVALALIIGITYQVILIGVFGEAAMAGFLPPVVGAWGPAILASLFAVNRLTTLRT
jgi:lipopolysaccharide export system permease protein